jgi:plasmid stabilization system protein ParE
MRNVEVHPAVYVEMENARAWYESQRVNLGNDFLAEVDRAIESIRESPDLWPVYYGESGVRRMLLHRFPFSIIYRAKGTVIQVVAVMHLRRRPGYWKKRIE